MIIGFLGKGGSGKSTLATLVTKYLLDQDSSVLAIDADHNMDFSFNLGALDNIPYFGKSIGHIKEHIGLQNDANYRLAFFTSLKNRFNFSPNDSYTKEYVVNISDKLSVMVAGPHTDELWLGNGCSHGLFTSLKIYLPFLDLQDKQYVVIDEKAGMDPVGTMVPAGFDVAIVVSEPTLHSTKTANQICMGLEKYGTPYITVGNKVANKEQEEFLINSLYKKPTSFFSYDIKNIEAMKNNLSEYENENLEKIIVEAKKISDNISREKRCVNFWTGLAGKAQT